MFKMSYKVAEALGIPIKLHISLLLMALFLIVELKLVNGLIVAVGLVTSIALHELGHSFIAIRKGCRVREITLFILGGAAQMESIPTKPKDELLMAVAGPFVSLAVGLSLLIAGAKLPLQPFSTDSGPLNIIQFLGGINIMLVFFNLIPAFPMDGGRVFRSLLARKFGRLKATYIAAQLGKIIAILFGALALAHKMPILILIAVFVYIMAGNEYRSVIFQERQKDYRRETWQTSDHNADDDIYIGPPPYAKKDATDKDKKHHFKFLRKFFD